MKKMIMSETAAAYGIVVMLVLFALMTSCSSPYNVHAGFKHPKPLHTRVAHTSNNACGYWGGGR